MLLRTRAMPTASASFCRRVPMLASETTTVELRSISRASESTTRVLPFCRSTCNRCRPLIRARAAATASARPDRQPCRPTVRPRSPSSPPPTRRPQSCPQWRRRHSIEPSQWRCRPTRPHRWAWPTTQASSRRPRPRDRRLSSTSSSSSSSSSSTATCQGQASSHRPCPTTSH